MCTKRRFSIHLKHRLHLVGQRTCGWNPSGQSGSPFADGFTCCMARNVVAKTTGFEAFFKSFSPRVCPTNQLFGYYSRPSFSTATVAAYITIMARGEKSSRTQTRPEERNIAQTNNSRANENIHETNASDTRARLFFGTSS